MTRPKTPQLACRAKVVNQFITVTRPLVGLTECDDSELKQVLRFVVKHLDVFRVIDRAPANESELVARGWLNELATLPPGSISLPDRSLSKLRSTFGRIPRSKGSIILSPSGQASGDLVPPKPRWVSSRINPSSER